MIRPVNLHVKRPALPDKAARRARLAPLDTSRSSPSLRFSPTAWAKLLHLRDLGETEVGGFGISAADDLLLVEDVQLVRQTCSVGTVAFDDQSVADFFDCQVDAGVALSRCARIWLHTHPGSCPQPSMTDEETFARVFGRCDWAVMFILARGGQTYVRMRFNVGPGGSLTLPVEVDYRRPFQASDQEAWGNEYFANVEVQARMSAIVDRRSFGLIDPDLDILDDRGDDFGLWHDRFDDGPGGFLPQTTERRGDDGF
jgi:hypothetical protein